MFTPQQIEEISFNRVTFGGYDTKSVDDVLGPLTEDYVALYKENSLLKSKMRTLVAKLEEYRNNEASMKQAILDAQNTCDTMVKETEAKCAQMLSDANFSAAESSRHSTELLEAENARLEAMKRATNDRISAIETQLRACLETLSALREGNMPTVSEGPSATDLAVDEISNNIASIFNCICFSNI